jgi:hypothetical protein
LYPRDSMDQQSAISDKNSGAAVQIARPSTTATLGPAMEQDRPGTMSHEAHWPQASQQGPSTITIVPSLHASDQSPQASPGPSQSQSETIVNQERKCCCAPLITWWKQKLSGFPCVKRCLDGRCPIPRTGSWPSGHEFDDNQEHDHVEDEIDDSINSPSSTMIVIPETGALSVDPESGEANDHGSEPQLLRPTDLSHIGLWNVLGRRWLQNYLYGEHYPEDVQGPQDLSPDREHDVLHAQGGDGRATSSDVRPSDLEEELS